MMVGLTFMSVIYLNEAYLFWFDFKQQGDELSVLFPWLKEYLGEYWSFIAKMLAGIYLNGGLSHFTGKKFTTHAIIHFLLTIFRYFNQEEFGLIQFWTNLVLVFASL